MKYKTALAAVFAKYRNPRTRTCALALLERYGSPARPVTAWHAVGEDADASRLLLEGLGFSEKEHFTVQRSVLDPDAARISWTDAGLALVARMAAELRDWDGAAAQRRVLTPGAGDPLELVPDAEDVASASAAPRTDGFTSKVLEMTKAVARAVINLSSSSEAVLRLDAKTFEEVLAWAKYQDDGLDDSDKTPVAPLAVAEALARMRGNVPNMPPFQVFDADDARYAGHGWQASRPMGHDDAFPAAGRVNLMPLAEQQGPCGQLDGYFAWNVSQWRKFPEGRDCVWTQFDARIRRTADALQFALDADRMRRFASAVMEAAYPGLSCGLVSTTRLAVGNTALGGAPGNEELDDDGDTSQLQCRIDDSAFPYDAPVYMGAHLLVAGRCDAGVEWTCATHPVEIATGDPEEDAAAYGVRADEIANEWFLVAHGGVETAWPHRNDPWRPAPERRKTAERNLSAFRAFVAENLRSGKDRLLDMCEPTNPVFNRRGDDGDFTVEGSFVNGVAAAMRHYASGGLEFVRGSPFFPDKIFAGVWSGIGTDLAPTRVEEAAEAGVFPNLAAFSFASYAKANAPTRDADALVKLMRDRPDIQLRYGKRTSGVARMHTIVLETNVSARQFVEKVSAADNGAAFLSAMWRTFYTSFVTRRSEPLASVDESFAALGSDSYSLAGFREWVNSECPGWADDVGLGPYGKLPPRGFYAGWLEDSLGRLILVFRSTNPSLTLRVKAAWRYAHSLPVPSAAYLAKAGRTKAAVLTPDMTDDARYKAVLRAAMNQEGFVHDCVSTVGLRGVFGTAWIRDAVWDMDADEVPARGWYMFPGCTELVGSYATPF